jgi:cytoskeletal protein CcmA (bactofilin family)
MIPSTHKLLTAGDQASGGGKRGLADGLALAPSALPRPPGEARPTVVVGRIRRAGSIYLHVLASSLLLTILGLASLAAVRLQMQSSRLTADYATARACATSALELGLLYVKQDANWRTTRPNGTWLPDQVLGAGHFTLQGIDPKDNILSNSPYEPVVLTGVGTKGIARHKAQVTLTAIVEPLAALNTCLHAGGGIQVKAGKQITVIGGAVSTNGQLDNDGTIDGNAEAQSLNHTGVVTGTLVVPGVSKQMPAATVMTEYINKATAMTLSGTIDQAVLGPGCNTLGPTDPNGLYYINTNGADLTIKNTRIYGTLIVRTGDKTLTLDTAVFFQNYRPDFPTLLVDGNLILKYQSASLTLSEAANSRNYNPLGAPYEGATDGDTLDQYPNEIRGLVHVNGNLNLQQSARIVGVVLCEGSVVCENANTITRDADLYASPPTGYTYVPGMQVSPHSWKQVVD